MGVREDISPFSFLDRDNGQIVGVEVDLVEAIARKLGVTLKLVPVTASGRIEALYDGKVDLVAAAFTKTPDRAKVVDFSLTYFRTRQRVLAAGAFPFLPPSWLRKGQTPAGRGSHSRYGDGG